MLNFLNIANIISLLMAAAAALISITVHEYCHGFAAYKLGDDTAKIYGRLSLNPLKHIDWFGAFCLVVFKFGWAKPVPINTYNLKKPRRDIPIISLAGPVSNFLLAFVSLFIFYLVPVKEGFFLYLRSFLMQMIFLNLGLGLFNLIPIPPLDGSKVLASFLPAGTAYKYLNFGRYGTLLLVLLLLFGALTPYLNLAVAAIGRFFEIIIQFLLGI